MYYIFFTLALGLWCVILNFARANKLSNIIVIIIITILFVTNRQNQDYAAYVDIFNGNELYAEIGYQWLILIVKYFGGTHDVIIGVLGCFFGITCFRISKYSRFTAFGLVLYMLCPMPIDIVQIRNTFLFLFIINALIELEKKRRINSLIFVFFAVAFHSLGIIYAIAWFVLQFRKWEKFNKLMMLGLLLSFILVPLLIKILILIFDTRTLHAYISDTIKIHSLIIWGGPYLFDLFLISYIRKRITISDDHIKEWINIVFSLLLFLSVFAPLLLYIDEINRIFRNALILKYLIMMSLAQYMNRKTRYLLYSYLLGFTFALSIYYTLQIDYNYIVFGIN